MEDPIIFTKIVAKGKPKILKFKRLNRYRKLEPNIAPTTSAIYEDIGIYFTN